MVWGRDDGWIPLADADRFIGGLTAGRKVVLERCGHVPQEERPADVSRLLEAFLDGAGGGDIGSLTGGRDRCATPTKWSS